MKEELTTAIASWGRYPQVAQHSQRLAWSCEPLPRPGSALLPFGLGRSYGDSCLNDQHTLLLTRGLDRFLAFDRKNGLLRCESGVSLAEILALVVPHGWFLPVTPGTKFVTVGGAVANDVHGKNHHRAGSFGNQLRAFELLRSDGRRLRCAAEENADYFTATIGGLGLTGLITWVELQLKPIVSPLIEHEVIRFSGLAEFFALSLQSAESHEYTVAWIDCLASGNALGRGHFIRGNHATTGAPLRPSKPPWLTIPCNLPRRTLNPLTLHAFNRAYYWRQPRKSKHRRSHYDPFFYPLDAVNHWNRLYGRPGFFQYQCVVPFAEGPGPIQEILAAIAAARQGSFLAVLKTFGSIPSRGLLSFPRPGVTLALDFPNRGAATLNLFTRLDALVGQAGGALYPAKDARMSPAIFRLSFPRLEQFIPFLDPSFSSTFWRRVNP